MWSFEKLGAVGASNVASREASRPGYQGDRPREHAGAVDDLGHRLFLPVGHDVHAADAANLANLLYEIDAEVAAFARLILGAGEALDDGVGDVHAGNVLAHPFGRLRRAQRPDAGEDVDLVEQPERLDLVHEGAQQRQIVHVLRLDELRPGGDLLGEAQRAPLVGQGRGIFGGAQEHARRETDLASALKVVIIAQGARDLEQRHAIQIEHRLRLRMIARLHTVAGQAQHVAHAHRRAAENIALNRDAVLVPAGDLHDRRIADARQQRTDGHARHVAVRAAAVGRVDGVHIAVEHTRALVHIVRIGRVRGRELGGDHEAAGAQHPLEAPRRSMPGQDRQRIARHRFVLESHGAAFGLPPFVGAGAGAAGGEGSACRSRTTLSHEDRPCRRWSTANCTWRIASMPPGMR